MHEQELVDSSKPNPGPVAARVRFEALCVLEKLDDIIIHFGAIERPVPSKNRLSVPVATASRTRQ